MVRLLRILHCAEEIALNNSLFTYDKTKNWYSICDSLKQVSTYLIFMILQYLLNSDTLYYLVY